MSIEELKYKLSKSIEKIGNNNDLIKQLNQENFEQESIKCNIFNKLEEQIIKKHGKGLIRLFPNYELEYPVNSNNILTKNQEKLINMYRYKLLNIGNEVIDLELDSFPPNVYTGYIIVPYNEITDCFNINKAWIINNDELYDIVSVMEDYFDYCDYKCQAEYGRNIKEDVEKIVLNKHADGNIHDIKNIDIYLSDCPKECLRKLSKVNNYQLPFAIVHCEFYMKK